MIVYDTPFLQQLSLYWSDNVRKGTGRETHIQAAIMKSDHLLFRSVQHSAGGIDYRHVPTTLFPLAAFTSPQPLHHQILPSPTPFITIICLKKKKKNTLRCNGTNWIYGVMEPGHHSKSVQGENFQQETPEHPRTPTQFPPHNTFGASNICTMLLLFPWGLCQASQAQGNPGPWNFKAHSISSLKFWPSAYSLQAT